MTSVVWGGLGSGVRTCFVWGGKKFCRGKGGAGTVCLLENVAAGYVSSNQHFEELYVARGQLFHLIKIPTVPFWVWGNCGFIRWMLAF